MDKSSAARSSLESTLELSIENLRQINVMVQDIQPQTQSVLNQKVQSIVTNLQSIDKLKDCVADVQIPLDVIDFVDSGRNPQLFNKKSFEAAANTNAEVKGKIDNYRRFKAALMVNMNQKDMFPKELAAYRTMRDIKGEIGNGKKDKKDDSGDDDEENATEEEEIDVGVETPAVVAGEK